MFFEVIPTEVFRSGGGALTYASDQALKPGQVVLIPLGKRNVTGIVLRKIAKVDFPTKPITRLVHPYPLPDHLISSLEWLAEYYLSPLPSVANLLIPSGLTARGAMRGSLGDDSPKVGKDSPKAQKVPSRGHQAPSRAKSAPSGLKLPLIDLNPAQKQALAALKTAPGATKLLRGVTGSGKTNIYLKLAADSLKAQKSVILLVPEIALTSQLVQIFEHTFGQRVTLIHSNQTLVERRRTWLELHESTYNGGEARIIIGPRSALLAPVHNLGLILIDEAHESAYYQENTPRYSAVRLASFMAAKAQISCVTGTATPNIVDFYLAKTHHSLVELATRAKTTAIDPKVELVDLKDRANFPKNRYFSAKLLAHITANLAAKQQTLIFHNRRGSAPLTICEDCGWQALCPNCYLPLTLHANDYQLVCHLCGHQTKVPSSCPSCHHAGILHKGFGTKLLESELASLFPEAKIARFDGDNKKTADLASLYNEVKSGKIDILIGTQTLARGLDLPHLATVGIVQADAGLALPDFAAEERCFELLTQVIGRVGRGHLDAANVVVQTYQPEHPVVQTALKADYYSFAKYLLGRRRAQQLPPFTYLARLLVTYKTEKTTLAKIRTAFAALARNPALTVSPPAPAFHERGNQGYTWQLVVKSTSRQALVAALKPFQQFKVELDPPSML